MILLILNDTQAVPRLSSKLAHDDQDTCPATSGDHTLTASNPEKHLITATHTGSRTTRLSIQDCAARWTAWPGQLLLGSLQAAQGLTTIQCLSGGCRALLQSRDMTQMPENDSPTVH